MIILEDKFSNLDNWTDLTTVIPWGNNLVGTSGFSTGINDGQQAVFLNRSDDDAIDVNPYTGYTQSDDLKSFTALDFTFPEPIVHQKEILTIEFDARWDSLNNSGEAGRFMVVLMDDYPDNGIRGEDFNNFNGDPFGTPALHLRIRPSNFAESFLQYGGGNGGEFEQFGNNWWLPGFISNAEGTGSGSPGQGNKYPFGSWQETTESLGSEDWQTYTYKIFPDRQEVYVEDNLVGSMALPQELTTAPQYEYYEEFEALRLYWRGVEPTYISNFQITTQAINETETNMLETGVVVNENFADGNFENDTVDHWTINGQGTAFRVPNNRNFNFALANQIAAGGGSFTDNFAFGVPDATTTHPSGLKQFGIAKEDEVAIVRYTTFSDIARDSREQFHVQVALLQTDPNLEGSPNFGHDLSIETESRFVSRGASHPDRLQLTANVENTENITLEQKNAYYSNTMTAGDLDREYSNLVIWRDLPGEGGTNIEQWAANAIGDYDVAAEMVNEFEPNLDPNNALFNEVRVFLQRGGTNINLIRDGISIEDAQIGIVDLHVGVTKRTDFNLDYITDAKDFILWNTYYNSVDTSSTILTGDANNNNAVEVADLELWKLNRGEIHDGNFNISQSVYTYDAEAAINSDYVIPRSNNTEPIFAYNPSTGELAVNTQGESLVSWIIKGQVANSVASLGTNWWIEAVGNSQQWVDLDLTGLSSNELVMVANLNPGLDITDLGTIEVGFAGGGGQLITPTVIEDEGELDDAELIAELQFEDGSGTTATDSSPFGDDNFGTLTNGANFQNVGSGLGNVVNFDGENDYIAIANSTDINLQVHPQRTVSLFFQADDINISDRKQVLYEEGGTIRGLNIYLDAGQLYVGGWNTRESGWLGTYHTTDEITSNQWHHVALVLDGESTVEPDSFIAYLDGQEFARGEGSKLWYHGDGIGLGNVNGSTRFHNGNKSGLTQGFSGNIDEVQIYNRSLNNTEIEGIYSAITLPETAIMGNEGLISHLEFNETDGTVAADTSPFGDDNFGTLLNGADFKTVDDNSKSVVNFDGDNDYVASAQRLGLVEIANSTDINLRIHQQRTISLWFQADDANISNRKQVLYEEGGTIRGLNIYLDAGQLYVGGWNTPESGWLGTYHTTDEITSNQWHHVALVLDGESTVEPDSFIAYLDGQEFARGEGSKLWYHGDGIGLGNVNGATKFHDSSSSGLNYGFSGNLDEVQIYNRSLDSSEIEELFTSFDI